MRPARGKLLRPAFFGIHSINGGGREDLNLHEPIRHMALHHVPNFISKEFFNYDEQQTDNRYCFLVDCSCRMHGSTVLTATGAVIKAHRALRCISAYNTKMHIVGYNERGMYLSPFRNFPIAENSNFKEDLKLLKFTIHCQCDCESNQTRSIFLFNTLGEVLSGWLKPVQSLYMFLEFAKGLRYVYSISVTDKKFDTFSIFADLRERILPYFSDNRLDSLIETVAAGR